MKKVLLDENLPRPLATMFTPRLEVVSVHDIGWAEKKNGELIQSMLEEGFEFLLTADKSLQYQQNLERYPVKVVVLRVFDNRLKTIAHHVPYIEERIWAAGEDEKVIEIDLRGL
jgi:predicted nuclease of predicted toxin-antitoxin system